MKPGNNGVCKCEMHVLRHTYDKIQEGCGIFFPVSKEKYENVASNFNRWKIPNQMGVEEVNEMHLVINNTDALCYICFQSFYLKLRYLEINLG